MEERLLNSSVLRPGPTIYPPHFPPALKLLIERFCEPFSSSDVTTGQKLVDSYFTPTA